MAILSYPLHPPRIMTLGARASSTLLDLVLPGCAIIQRLHVSATAARVLAYVVFRTYGMDIGR